MNNVRRIFIMGVLIVCFGFSQSARATTTEKIKATTTTEQAATTQPAAQTPPMDAAMMAKWKEYSTPNENHHVLDQLVGSWEYTMKWWMKPDSQPEESTGSSQSKWIMDGRFVQQTVQGQSMGQPFDGTGISGYDNAKKAYIGTWFDNMGTGMMNATGQYDPSTKTLTQEGIFDCPFKGRINFRWVTKFVDEDTQIFESYAPDDTGKEFKSMEIVYKRKK